MDDIYTRSKMMLTDDQLEKIKNSKVLIFGLGGVGGMAFEVLVRLGIQDISVVDGDSFEISNLNRQILSTRNNISNTKVDEAVRRAKEINPDCHITPLDMFYLPSNLDIDFSLYDVVIDCIDTVTSKIDIICRCKEAGVYVISSLGCGNRFDPSKLVLTDLFDTKDDPIARIMRNKLRKKGITSVRCLCSTEKPFKLETEEEKRTPASLVFVPNAAGILLAYDAFRYIISK